MTREDLAELVGITNRHHQIKAGFELSHGLRVYVRAALQLYHEYAKVVGCYRKDLSRLVLGRFDVSSSRLGGSRSMVRRIML